MQWTQQLETEMTALPFSPNEEMYHTVITSFSFIFGILTVVFHEFVTSKVYMESNILDESNEREKIVYFLIMQLFWIKYPQREIT